MSTLPVFGITRHRLLTDGDGVTSLVGAYGCPLQCKYCLNPHAWNPETLKACKHLTPQELYDKLKIDDLYFKATNGGVCFGGGESLLHAEFISEFKKIVGSDWKIIVETSLNIPENLFRQAMDVVDFFIVDIKDMNPEIYLSYTGKDNQQVIKNLQLMADAGLQEKVMIRLPKIPGHNTEADINASRTALEALNYQNFDIFPYIQK